MSARIGAAEVHAVMHLVGATSALQRAHGLVELARQDLGAVECGVESYNVWQEILALRTRIEGIRLKVKALALNPEVRIGIGHTGVDCEHCKLAEHVGAPESHGERRSGGAS